MSRYQHNSYTFVLLGGELRTYYGDDHNLEPAGPTRRDHVIRRQGQLVAMIDADTVTRMEVLRHNEPDHATIDGYVNDAGGGHIDIIVHRDATISFNPAMHADKPRDALPEPEPAHGAPTDQADTEWLAGLPDTALDDEIAARVRHFDTAHPLNMPAAMEAANRATRERTLRRRRPH